MFLKKLIMQADRIFKSDGGIPESINTDTAPTCTIGAKMVEKPDAKVMTSSPGLIRLLSARLAEVNAEISTKLAEGPKFTSS
jgi:hypothetical protein